MSWRKFARFVAVSGAATVVLFVVTGIALVLWRDALLNTRAARGWLTTQLQAQFGREVTLQGRLRVPGFAAAGFPWVVIEIGAGVIGNPPEYVGPALFTWRSLRTELDLRSLREEFPRLGPITLDDFVAEPGVDAEGDDNFSDFGPADDSPARSEWAVSAVQLQGGRIRYQDRSGGALDSAVERGIELDNSTIRIEQLTRGAGVRSNVWSARAISVAGDSLLPFSLTSAAVELNLDANASMGTQLTIALGEARVVLSDWRVEFPATAPLHATARLILDALTLPAWLQALGYPLPGQLGERDQLQIKDLTAQLTLSGPRLEIDALQMRLDDSRVTGRIRFETLFDLALRIDRIDLDRYATRGNTDPAGSAADPAALFERLMQTLRPLPLTGSVRCGEIRAAGVTLRGVTLGFETHIDSLKNQ